MHYRYEFKTEKDRRKKIIVSYARMVASLSVLGIDLEWAENQYWSTLTRVIGEIVKIRTPKKKEKVSASQMSKFIKD